MQARRDFEYHRQRAHVERDRADRAQCAAAAEAHLRLASLHIDRLKQEDERCSGVF